MAQTTEVERVDDPISHCLADSLLLTGLPGTGKTYLARTIAARLREQGEPVHLAASPAFARCFRARTCAPSGRPSAPPGPGSARSSALGDFRQLLAVLDSWAGRPISAPLEHSQLIRDLAGGHRHELTENMRYPGILNFVKWLRVGE